MNNDNGSQNQSSKSEPLLEKQKEKDFGFKPTEIDNQKVNLSAQVSSACSKLCTKKFWLLRLPIFSWIKTYKTETLLCDTIAGVTTALTVIPQGIGYAPLAGLPLQYGLYGSILPGFIYCILGTTSQSTVGPTAVNFLMSHHYAGGCPYKAITLAFWSGLIEILAGMLNLGFLIQFVSGPVMSAFTSVVSILVITSCVKGFFGVKIDGRGFVNVWTGLFKSILSIQLYDMAVGIICMVILYFLRVLKEYNWCEGDDKDSKRCKVVQKTKWLMSISSNCIVVLLVSIAAWILVDVAGYDDILTLTGKVDSGIPSPQLPWLFNRNISSCNSNATIGPTEPFDLAGEFGLGLVMIPLVSILQHLAIAKHYAGNKKMAASQEMIALGFCQFLGSFFGSAAITASFGRSAVNARSGVKTPFGGVITGVIILLTCAFLSPYLAYIPTSALSAVIIFAMFFTIEYSVPVKLWKGRKIDLIPYLLTFLVGLFVSVEMGLISGTLINMIILIYYTSSPNINIQDNQTHIVFRFDSSLYYPAKDNIVREIRHAVQDKEIVILDLNEVKNMDYSVATGIAGLMNDLQKKKNVALVGVNTSVMGVIKSVHGDNLSVYSTVEEVLNDAV